MIPAPRGAQNRARRLSSPILVLLVCVLGAPTSAAASTNARARYVAADRAMVRAATELAACRARHRPPCAAAQRRLGLVGLRLSAAQRRLPNARASLKQRRADQQPPVTVASGAKLKWSRVGGVRNCLVLRKRKGRSDAYFVVGKSSYDLHKGSTYAVRTAIVGSAWSRQTKVIAPSRTEMKKAPVLSVDDKTLRWSAVASLTKYVIVTNVPGAAPRYDAVEGTIRTPVPHPGQTVTYSVRTNVTGSRWAAKQTVTFPAVPSETSRGSESDFDPTTAAVNTQITTSSPAPKTTTPTPQAPAPSAQEGFEFGMNSGSALQWELGFIRPLGAKHVRAEFPVGSTVESMAPAVEAYAKAGIRPLLLAHVAGRVPTSAEAANMGRWAEAYGPGGTFWRGKGYPASVAATEIEFINEINNPWNYAEGSRGSDWYNDPAFLQRAKDYAGRVREAGAAVRAANPAVGVLAVGDEYAGYTTWMDAMLTQVPDLADYVKGWTIHPYGPDWKLTMDALLSVTRERGAERPMYATEWGVATDNGTCLSDNFGWAKCQTYAAAAGALSDAVSGMRARYGSRLAAVYLYSDRDLGVHGVTVDREAFFGAVRSDGGTKGPYTDAVKTQLAASA